MQDFTFKAYEMLLDKIRENKYNFKTFLEFLLNSKSDSSTPVVSQTSTAEKLHCPIVILRHDVDRSPENALKLAQLENSRGIKGTYYFRIVPESFDINIMEKISILQHEIGYHYEDVALVYNNLMQNNKLNENEIIEMAHASFCKNLNTFRQYFDIKTICMHGSPRSKYDNKLIWARYDYKYHGIKGEPYFDIDYNEFAYFTDTGRCWNNSNISVRDKVTSKFNFNLKSTFQIIDNLDKFPDKLIFTIHPQRWNDKTVLWFYELIAQNIKNMIKKYFYIKF